MNLEQRRLSTFKSWPSNAVVDPQRIAKAGFFYTGIGMEVECFSCNGKIIEWDYGDQVMARHRQLYPECPFVKDPIHSGNVPLVQRSPSLYSQVSDCSINNSNSLNTSSIGNEGIRSSLQGSAEENQDRSCSSVPHSRLCHVPDLAHTTTGEATTRTSPSLFESESVRLQSFLSWPKSNIVAPEQLARVGFFYLQEEDRVQCAFCSGVLEHWVSGDDPEREHRRRFPSCPLFSNIPVENVSSTEENTSTSSNHSSHNNTCDNIVIREVRPFSGPERLEERNENILERPGVNELGIHSHRGPRHPKYSTVESRLRTFVGWPAMLPQTPQQLAQAGFYYTGTNDQVRCFHCDGGLRQWDEHDDPWIEHARWFSKCTYVVLVKGEDFIKDALVEHPPLLSTNEDELNRSRDRDYQVREVTEEELQGLMSTESVRVALSMGLDGNKIKQVLRQKVEQTGLPYTTCEALVEAVLDVSSDTNTPDSPPAASESQAQAANIEPSHPVLRSNPENEVQVQQALTLSKSLPSLSRAPAERSAQIRDANTQSMPVLPRAIPSTSSCGRLGSEHVSLEEENRRLKEARLCKICMDEEVGVVFVPCGHLVTCVNCTPSIEDCPMCRQPIKATVRTFLS